MSLRSRDLLVFVHVPKTAGSSISKALRNKWPDGIDHVENIIDRTDFAEKCQQATWISGHIPQPTFAKKLQSIDRSKRYFTCIREPLAQLMSHVNWLNEIRHRGDQFFYNHPREIQLISFLAASMDYSNPASVCAFLLKHHHLFLNCQSRYVWGKDHGEMSLDEKTRMLRSFECIGTSENLQPLVEAMEISSIPRENAATYRFSKDVFGTKELGTFLQYNHRSDFELNNMIQGLNASQ